MTTIYDRLTMGVPADGAIGPISELLAYALHYRQMSDFMEIVGLENFREVRLDGEVVAGVGYVPMGHWFGGRIVPAIGVTAVGVAPEQRRSGVGSAMMRLMLEEMYRDGWPLTSLYPATVTYYRRAGFERAGYRISYELLLSDIDTPHSPLQLAPIEEKDYPTVRRLYDERARLSAGLLDRTEWMWRRKFEIPEAKFFKYLLMRDGEPEGYIIYRPGERTDPIRVVDYCALTPDAGRRALSLLASYGSMVEKVLWSGGPLDPFLYLLNEPVIGTARMRVKMVSSLDWMLRLVDVEKALAERGYPTGLKAELHLEVADDILPQNNGPFVLEIDGSGRGAVTRGGEGRIRVDVRDLASIYTGFTAPAERTPLGTLSASPEEMWLMAAVFSGPRPWMADMF